MFVDGSAEVRIKLEFVARRKISSANEISKIKYSMYDLT